MREILFRGKRVDNGEWVYGLPFKAYSTFYRDYLWTIQHLNKFEIPIAHYDIVPETIEQYTGLTDKNGTKIFEGDIVKHYNHCQIKEYSEDIGRVFYYAETCRFLRTSKLFPNDCPEMFSGNEYEVIGNIHDNSELLKDGKKNDR